MRAGQAVVDGHREPADLTGRPAGAQAPWVA